jgi:ethanolamine utilization cobalamin adenosyltransferase
MYGDRMTMIAVYPSKKILKEQIGKPLRYIETSHFGNEYKANGTITVANRPHITNIGREFFAQVTMENGLIKKVA